LPAAAGSTSDTRPGPPCSKSKESASRGRSLRIDSIQIKAHSRREFELWTTLVLLVLALGAGFAGVLAPTLAWHSMTLHLSFKYLPQLFWGMVGLIALFSIYATQ
jgi:hypothetical protein